MAVKEAAGNVAKATVTITQLRKPKLKNQIQSLKGLGLGARHRTSTIEDTPSTRGMINVVKHLIQVAGEK